MSDNDNFESELFEHLHHVPFDDRARDDHRTRLREQTLAAFDRAAQARPIVIGWKRTLNRGRMIMQRPLTRYVAIGAACAAVLAIWMFAPGHQSSAHAFNMFAEALVNARSATFEMTVEIEGQPKQTAKSYYLAPGKFRNELPNMVTISNFEAARIVTRADASKTFAEMKFVNVPDDPKKRQTFDLFGKLRELLAENRDSKDEQYARLGEKMIDGRRAIGFHGATALVAVTMWGDPETGLPLLVETVWSGTPSTRSTMKDFKLNAEVDPALFDTTAPAGYKVMSFEVDAAKPTEADLVAALRAIADVNDGEFLDRLDTASMQSAMMKRMFSGKEKKPDDISKELMQLSLVIGRGVTWALELTATADVYYAGKGIKLGEPDRPVFWYKSKGQRNWRVIYADLSVQDSNDPPEVADAQSLSGLAVEKKKRDAR
jgi:outer membrane lipoprotein-sorting protein